MGGMYEMKNQESVIDAVAFLFNVQFNELNLYTLNSFTRTDR